jgi:serine/threonine protein kinase
MSHSMLPSPYPLPGEIIGDSWRVEKILGEGGMGAVARAWDLILHTPVAIKFMNPQYLTFPGAEERFINEGKASALIKSDHVVPVMKAGKTASGTPYLVMECLEGVDLADLIARDGPRGLPVERAVHFVLQVLRALQAAHGVGIIHRDMKPSNCFAVNKDGEEDFVKILDFGISKIQKPGSASLTQTNSALGTPLYMSPEQARSPRDVDARSDLYSVGVILYELLTGSTPFFSESGEFTEILFKLFTAEPPPVQEKRPDVPAALAAAVHKALAREVDNRFSSALEMAEALAPFASERSRHVLNRMRAFKAPPRASMAPDDLPQSMVAYSQLPHGPATGMQAQGGQTGVMPTLPTTDVVKGSPVTEMLPRAMGGGLGVPPPRLIEPESADHQTGAAENRMSAAPAAVGARARPDEASARTQFDNDSNPGRTPQARAVVVGAQTDLSTARDTSVMTTKEAPPPPKRQVALYALPVVVLALIGGSALGVIKMKGEKIIATPPPPPSAVALPTATASATDATNVTAPPVLPSAIPSAAPSASASASASASVVKTRPQPPPPQGPAGTVPPPGPKPGVLDTKPIQ